jgi:hypothetical protein
MAMDICHPVTETRCLLILPTTCGLVSRCHSNVTVVTVNAKTRLSKHYQKHTCLSPLAGDRVTLGDYFNVTVLNI